MSAAERTNVLLEEIRAQNRATYEGVTGAVESLDRKIEARFKRLEERVTLLENVVRTMSNELRELRAEVRQLRHDFDHRAELSRLEALERRVAVLEKRRTH